MLEFTVYDRGNAVVLTFEHSLLSVSKWEAKYKIPFLTKSEKTQEQMLDYYRFMITSPELDPDLVYRLKPEETDQLLAHINDPMSAAIAPPPPDGKKSSEVQTSDSIYMQLVLLRIPFQPTETWHINRVMMLIAKTAHAQQPPKKEKPGTLLSRWQDINKANRERFNSKG